VNAVYVELAERIRGEASDLDRVVQRASAAWLQAQRVPDADAYLDSVALNLHGFYSGLERLFELVVRHVDHSVPTGETWHRSLLQQVAQDIADVRPAVISPNSAQALDEFRRFRHLVRNVYTMNLVPERMAGLLAALPGLWLAVRAELLAFADFLAFLAQAD
jgi:hypothetical protein